MRPMQKWLNSLRSENEALGETRPVSRQSSTIVKINKEISPEKQVILEERKKLNDRRIQYIPRTLLSNQIESSEYGMRAIEVNT